ncbi:MAG: replication initiation factor domain-containing protein [Steroidobacteraceae bacterium]|nr:replication initiation factor domain-containing protein [Deltaproteobacteria bacterium]
MSRITCDYLKFTVPTDLDDAALDELCREFFGHPFRNFDKLGNSRDRYADCFSLGGLVNVYRKGFAANAGTTCFDLPGDALRKLQVDTLKLCQYIRNQGGNVCRFDICADDTDNLLPFDEVVRLSTGSTFKELVRTKLCRNRKDSTGEIVQVLPEISVQPRRVMYGSPKSDNYAVIYDREYCAGAEYPFLRVELRLTNRKDTSALLMALTTPGADPAAYMAGVLKGKLDFLEMDNPRKDRRSTLPWWNEFLNGAEVHKLKREPKTSIKIESLDVARARRAFERLKDRGDSEGLQQLFALIDNDQEARRIAFPQVVAF